MSDPAAPAWPGFEGWSSADDIEAHSLGWGIFDCDGSESGRFQLCRDDDAEAFPNDEAAWRHVCALAEKGDALAQRALAFIEQHNPAESGCIRQYLLDYAAEGPEA